MSTLDATAWLTGYVVLLLFVPSRLVVGPLGSAGAPSMLFGLGSVLLWCFLFLIARQVPLQPRPLHPALGVFLFCVGVSYVLAMANPLSPDEASPADVALLALVSWSGTLILTQDGVSSRSRLDTLIWRAAVCGGLIAALGLIQLATRQLWVDQLSIPGLSSGPSYGLTSRGGFPRPAGTATHPIEFGVLLSIVLPLAFHVGFFRTQLAWWVRWLPAAALVSIIPLTSSRSAYVGALLAVSVCMLGWSRARRRGVLAVGAAGLLAMVVVTPNFLDSVTELFTGAADDPSIDSRTGSFSMAAEFIARRPWFGRGLGTFLPKYRIFDNEYLLLLVTVGIVGTVAFLIVGGTAIAMLLRLRRRLPDESSRDIAMALVASTAAGFVCLFMFDAFAFPMTMGTLFLVLGMAGALHRLESARADLVVP